MRYSQGSVKVSPSPPHSDTNAFDASSAIRAIYQARDNFMKYFKEDKMPEGPERDSLMKLLHSISDLEGGMAQSTCETKESNLSDTLTQNTTGTRQQATAHHHEVTEDNGETEHDQDNNSLQVDQADEVVSEGVSMRRQSVDMGTSLSTDVVLAGDYGVISPKSEDLDALGDGYFTNLVESCITTIKGCTSLSVAVESWADGALPKGMGEEGRRFARYYKRFLKALAIRIVTWLKMARIGLAVRISVALLLTYYDIVTDVLVSLEYVNTPGREQYFKASVGIMVLAISGHCIISYLNNKKKATKVRIIRLLTSLFMMTPVIDGYNVWVGKEKDLEEQFSPTQSLVASRVVELMGESLPESVIQTYILLNSSSEDTSAIMVFSILASLSASAFIMTDSSISNEREHMGKSYLGPYAHPVFGYVPTKVGNQMGLYFGMFCFLFGYLGLNIFTLTTMATHLPKILIPSIHVVEFILFILFLYKNGNIYFVGAPLDNEVISSVLVNLGYYLLMAFLPWTTLRNSMNCGGKMFSGWIMYTTLKNIIVSSYGLFALSNGGQTVQVSVFVSCITLVVLGTVLTLFNSHSEHRHTFYSNDRPTQYYEFDYFLSGDSCHFRTRDEAMGRFCVKFHPSYMRSDKVIEWVLTLDSTTSPLFKQPHTLPTSVTESSKETPPTFLFDIIRARIAWYSDVDDGRKEAVNEKLSSLEQQLRARASETPGDPAPAVEGEAD